MGNWNEIKENKEEVKEVKEQINIEFKSIEEAEKSRGLKIALYGDYATGKTHFALTAPEPIFILDTELGASPLAHNFKGKDIRILDIREENGCISYEKYKDAVTWLSKQEKIGTVVVDSITDVWSFSQEYGKVKVFKIKPEQRLAQQWDWGIINSLYLKPFVQLLNLNCNVIVTARAQEQWAGAGNPTGVYSPSWMKKTPYWLDVVIYNTKKIDSVGNLTFNSRVDKCRQFGNLMGKNFKNLTFDELRNQFEEMKK